LKEAETTPTVGEIMARKPATITPSRGLAFAMNLMDSRQVDSLVVVNDEKKIQGYVSIYDVSREFDQEDKQVKDIMQPFTTIIESSMPLDNAVHLLDQSKMSYIPIADSDNTLIGLLTRGSVVGHIKEVYSKNGSKGV